MKKLILVFVAVSSVLLSLPSPAETPAVVWTSYPARPGEHVLAHGGAWGENPRVEIGGHTVRPELVTETGLVFAWPNGLPPGIVEGSVVSSAGRSAPFRLNAPDVWWLQGDGGDTSAPGGWLRVFGRALTTGKGNVFPDASARGGDVVLINSAGQRTSLTLSHRDVWSLAAEIPASLPCGTYAVEVANGYAGGTTRAGSWTVAAAKKIWKDTVFDVTSFGAVANDGLDDTRAIRAALAAAARHGGGTVLLPRGRFGFEGTLVIPTNTLLRGLSRDLSQLYWLDTMDPPENLIEASHSFGIHDLFIISGQYRNGITIVNEMARAGVLHSSRTMLSHDVSLKRLRLKFISDQWRDMNRMCEYLPRYTMPGNGVMLRDVTRAVVEDCDIYCDKKADSTLFFIVTGNFNRMTKCRINGSGWAVFGGDHLIFENNEAWNCTYSVSSVTSRMFWSGNRQYDLFSNNRESVTHDGAKTAFFRGLAFGQAEGTRMTLSYPDTVQRRGKSADWVGYDIQIAEGRGTGQTRSIRAFPTWNDLTIDRPWDIAPDATSRFVVAAERRHLIYTDNDTEDSSTAIQLYGGATDCVLARNRCRRAGGFQGSGRDYYGVIPCWFVQFIGNVIEEGNGYRGGENGPTPGDAVIGAFSSSGPHPYTQSYIVRDNRIMSNGRIDLSAFNGIVEGNTICRSDTGVKSRRFAETLFIGENTFEDVCRPYNGLLAATFSSAERARIARARAAVLDRLIHPGAHPLKPDECDRLFGAEVAFKPWHVPFRAAVRGLAKTPFKVPVTVRLSTAAPTCDVCEISVPDGNGWTFGGPTVLRKTADGFDGELTVTAPRTAGFFSLPVTVKLSGKDWSVALVCETTPLTENRFMDWLYAVTDAKTPPKDLSKMSWQPVTKWNPHDQIDLRGMLGNESEKRSVVAVCAVEVMNETRFSFTRGGPSVTFLLDGKVVLGEGVGPASRAVRTLAPGRHTLCLFRPAHTPHDFMWLKCLHADPVRPGDYRITCDGFVSPAP